MKLSIAAALLVSMKATLALPSASAGAVQALAHELELPAEARAKPSDDGVDTALFNEDEGSKGVRHMVHKRHPHRALELPAEARDETSDDAVDTELFNEDEGSKGVRSSWGRVVRHVVHQHHPHHPYPSNPQVMIDQCMKDLFCQNVKVWCTSLEFASYAKEPDTLAFLEMTKEEATKTSQNFMQAFTTNQGLPAFLGKDAKSCVAQTFGPKGSNAFVTAVVKFGSPILFCGPSGKPVFTNVNGALKCLKGYTLSDNDQMNCIGGNYKECFPSA